MVSSLGAFLEGRVPIYSIAEVNESKWENQKPTARRPRGWQRRRQGKTGKLFAQPDEFDSHVMTEAVCLSKRSTVYSLRCPTHPLSKVSSIMQCDANVT